MAEFGFPFLGPLGMRQASILPSRTLSEAARIAVDPFREREYPLTTGLIAEAGVHAATILVPPLFRLMSEIRQVRQRPLTELWARTAAFLKRPVEFDPNSDPVLARHPMALRTYPMIVELARRLRLGRPAEARAYLRQNWGKLPTFAMPVIVDLLGDLGTRSLLREEGVRIMEEWRRSQAQADLKEQFPVEIFGKANLRGIVDYDQDAFGLDPLGRLGAALKGHETLLWKLVAGLPRGAHLADWGSGAGIFGHEIKAIRPDLRLTSVDQFAPEEILAAHADPPVDASTLRSEMKFLIGNALDVRLPEDQLADLLISVFLLPWVPDPLRFLAHMYNQLKPGGVLLATVHMEAYDIDRIFGERTLVRELWNDLDAQGVRAELTNQDRTLALRRPDDRILSVAASLEGTSYEERMHAFGVLSLYYSFYRRSSSGPRWLSLIPPTS